MVGRDLAILPRLPGEIVYFHHKHCTSRNFDTSIWYNYCILYSRNFLSAKNFVKSDHRAVRQEFISVKRRSSLVCSSVFRSSLFCLSIYYLCIHEFSDPSSVVLWKTSQKIALTKATKLNSGRKLPAINLLKRKKKPRELGGWNQWTPFWLVSQLFPRNEWAGSQRGLCAYAIAHTFLPPMYPV